MDYDFNTLINREDQGNMKYILTPEIVRRMNLISYAGAEMDFKTAPVIIDAIVRKAKNGLLGFTLADEKYLSSIQWWMKNMRAWEIEEDWIVPTYGTIHSVATAIRAFTDEGNGVIVQPPVYNRYEQAVRRTKREIVSNPLIYEGGKYSMDFDDLERCMKSKRNRLLILCNPHNPIAKVWKRSDLEVIDSLARKYNVVVFSDEIFGEITFNGHVALPYTLVAGAGSKSIVSTSLGKVFNFTGVNNANMIIPDRQTRDMFKTQRDADHYGSIDPLIHAAVCSGYGPEGADWVREMRKYIAENINMIRDFFQVSIPDVRVAEVEGSFVIWIDWRGLSLDDDELHSFLLNEAYLDLDRGINYGIGGMGFTRMNVATPRGKIEESLAYLFDAAARNGYAVSETLNKWR